MIEINYSKADMASVSFALRNIRGGAQTAIMRSVNKALTGVKTDMARETAKELALTQKRIKKDITVTKANKATLSGVVTTEGRPVNLEQFKARQNKKGVSVKILKSKPRQTIKGAFIFLGKAGKKSGQNRLVGWRDKDAEGGEHIGTRKKRPGVAYGAMPKQYRLPVEALYGPRIQDVTGKPEIIKKIEDKAGVRLEKELSRQTQLLLDKQKGRK